MENKQFLYQFTKQELLAKFNSDEAEIILKWVFRKQNFDISSWTNVSKKFKEELIEKFSLSLPKIIWSGSSNDGTIKFLMQLADNNTVETVIIPGKKRQTICLSSQVGCAVGCTFCHTGTQGLTRNLHAYEIIGQLLSANQYLKKNDLNGVSNIVFMGQGEPLNNFKNVKIASEVFSDQDGIAISKHKITLSTSGLSEQIKRWEEFPNINIAISLHAVRDDLRSELMPINKVHDLKRLFSALKTIPTKNSKRISYEYLLIKDLNDSQLDIDGLISLLPKKESKINIIPFNEYPESNFKRPSEEKILWFQKKLQEKGFVCTIRKTMGTDILAACGQLKSELEKVNLWK